MAIQTILVHTDLGFSADDRLRFAARLALAFDAHLVGGVATQADTAPPPDARMALQRFAGIVREEGLRSSATRLFDGPGGGDVSALHAHDCDLAIVGQSDRSLCHPLPDDLPRRIARRSERPVLAMPCAGWRAAPGGDVLLAWDGSPAATRAAAAALPLLRLARQVTLAARAASADAGVRWLAQHGIGARIQPLPAQADAGPVLLATAAACRAGLLVMGDEGDPAPSSVLRSMHLPVLLAA
jgi:hypothetical protein